MPRVCMKFFLLLPCVIVPFGIGWPKASRISQSTNTRTKIQKSELNTRLLLEAEAGDIATVKKLLAAGADINVIEDYSKTHTPLTYAAANGRVAMTNFLLSRGADPNGKGVKLSPLFWTVSNGQTQCVRILLQHGADPNRACVDSNRPVEFAAFDGEMEIVKLLIWRMPSLPKNEVRRLVKESANVALSKAVATEPLSAIKAAVKSGADVNNLNANDAEGIGSPLMRAAARGSVPILNYLLSHGAQVNLKDGAGRTALMYTGETDMYYSRVMPESMTSKMEKPLNGTMTGLLLRHGAKVNLCDKLGKTALMYAAQGNPEATALLIARGARINALDSNKRTALHWAATLRDYQSMKILSLRGARINAQDKQGATALMLASVQPDSPNRKERAMRTKALQLLQSLGAKSCLKDKEGRASSAYRKMSDSDFINGC